MRSIQLIARVNKGGTAGWLEVLINGLRASGEEAILLAGYVQKGELEDSCFDVLGGIRVQHLGRSISIWQDYLALLEIRRLIKLYKPTIINTHTAKAGVLGRIAALSLGRSSPIIIHTYHGHLLSGYFPKWKTALIILIEKLLAKKTKLILVSGMKVRDELIRVGIGDNSQYLIVKPGIKSFEKVNRKEIRKKLGLNESDFVVGWMGRLTDIKRPDRVTALARALPQFKFLVGGLGELEKKTKDSSPRNVKFLGWTSPSEIWGASDIALLTSENEAQPLSLIEAGFAGIPAVAEDVGSVSEVVLDGQTGFLANDFDSRRKAIVRLGADRLLVDKLGIGAKNWTTSEFTVESFISSHIKAYFDSQEW
jgi:glycosyltransferase involved in cell wall biosynthesis